MANLLRLPRGVALLVAATVEIRVSRDVQDAARLRERERPEREVSKP